MLKQEGKRLRQKVRRAKASSIKQGGAYIKQAAAAASSAAAPAHVSDDTDETSETEVSESLDVKVIPAYRPPGAIDKAYRPPGAIDKSDV